MLKLASEKYPDIYCKEQFIYKNALPQEEELHSS